MSKKHAFADCNVTPAAGNVFADLGFSPAEADTLLAEARAIVEPKLHIKDQLMTELAIWIENEHLKQGQAAAILKISRPRVSDVVNKKRNKFTIDALVDMMTRAGKQVALAVS